MQVRFKIYLSLSLSPPPLPSPNQPKNKTSKYMWNSQKKYPPPTPGNDFYSAVKIMSTVVNFIFSVYCKKNMYS